MPSALVIEMDGGLTHRTKDESEADRMLAIKDEAHRMPTKMI